jgi:hypothetical protein
MNGCDTHNNGKNITMRIDGIHVVINIRSVGPLKASARQLCNQHMLDQPQRNLISLDRPTPSLDGAAPQ